METGEKKMKQSILGIALILLLFGYYSTQRTDISRLKNTNIQNDISLTDSNNEAPQSETLYGNTGWEATGNFRFVTEKPYGPSQNLVRLETLYNPSRNFFGSGTLHNPVQNLFKFETLHSPSQNFFWIETFHNPSQNLSNPM
jgi:hypothetical protein